MHPPTQSSSNDAVSCVKASIIAPPRDASRLNDDAQPSCKSSTNDVVSNVAILYNVASTHVNDVAGTAVSLNEDVSGDTSLFSKPPTQLATKSSTNDAVSYIAFSIAAPPRNSYSLNEDASAKIEQHYQTPMLPPTKSSSNYAVSNVAPINVNDDARKFESSNGIVSAAARQLRCNKILGKHSHKMSARVSTEFLAERIHVATDSRICSMEATSDKGGFASTFKIKHNSPKTQFIKSINGIGVNDKTSQPVGIEICHTYSSSGVSSQRTRAAAIAHVNKQNSELLSRNTIKNRNKRKRKKGKKQSDNFIQIQYEMMENKSSIRFTTEYLKSNVVVFDGGLLEETSPKSNPSIPGWSCHKLKDGALHLCSVPPQNKGLLYRETPASLPKFMLLPREDAIKINGNGRDLCKAMAAVSKYKGKCVRGSSKAVFGDHKYCCIGSTRNRYSSGVSSGHYTLDGVTQEDWDIIVNAVRRSEHAFYSYADTVAIQHILAARELVNWETIKKTTDNNDQHGSVFFNGIAFGVNVYLRAHVDDNFTYSVIQVHVDDLEYCVHDEVVCYFCFPRLGVAVPLRPGDFLLVNALEYHCLSSRCNIDVDLFCVSSYLKTAIVSGNDNGRSLNEKEASCLREFEEKQREMKKGRR
jgi:hypothetical protein